MKYPGEHSTDILNLPYEPLVMRNSRKVLPDKRSVVRPKPSGNGPDKANKELVYCLARHAPHPRRVFHINSLDGPVCAIRDQPPVGLSIDAYKLAPSVNTPYAPLNTFNGLPFGGLRSIPYKERAKPDNPKFGLIRIDEGWRRELKALTEAVVYPILYEQEQESAELSLIQPAEVHPFPICRPLTAYYQRWGAMNQTVSRPQDSESVMKQKEGRPMPFEQGSLCRPGSRQLSRASLRPSTVFGATGKNPPPDYEAQVFSLLFQILQAPNVETVQNWLSCASDREKALILEMIGPAVRSRLVPGEANLNDQQDTNSQRITNDDSATNQPGARGPGFDRLVVHDSMQADRQRPSSKSNAPIHPGSTVKASTNEPLERPKSSVVLRYCKTSNGSINCDSAQLFNGAA